MEYVEGQPIDQYCRAHRLSISDRLELFRQVCAAVTYAHQNLVVHRDIKPSNILVTSERIPKLLDFGIAKLLDTDGDDLTVAASRSFPSPALRRSSLPRSCRAQRGFFSILNLASTAVPPNVRDNATKNRAKEVASGVTLRSEEMIDYSNFGELGEILKANWTIFGDTLRDISAVPKILGSLNTLRANRSLQAISRT